MSENVKLNDAALRKVEALRADYESVAGKPFDAFHCPILYRDENVELCRAHLINKPFRNSHGGWTIQRKDVDGFYGSHFEADFLALQERGRHDLAEVLDDHDLTRLLGALITVEGRKVMHYRPTGPVPVGHTQVALETPQGPVPLVLKMREDEVLDQIGSQWEIQTNRDLRLPSLVSALKAAHLTLFSLLGYRYALSAGGRFLGRTILGDFFEANNKKPKRDVLAAGEKHFRDFVNMVRPILGGLDQLQGTASDSRLCIVGAGSPWAIQVVIRTAEDRHAVLVPIFDEPESAAYFTEFLKSSESYVAMRLAEYKGDHFAVSPHRVRFHWCAANYHTHDA